MMRLGLDLGKKRIGIATSSSGIIASPYENYDCRTEQKDLEHIAKIVINFNVKEIIVGLPYNMDGTEGDMALYVREYCQKLQKMVPDCQIVLTDERLTSCEAEDILINMNYSREKRKKMLDAISATLILQSYLDKKKNQGCNYDN